MAFSEKKIEKMVAGGPTIVWIVFPGIMLGNYIQYCC